MLKVNFTFEESILTSEVKKTYKIKMYMHTIISNNHRKVSLKRKTLYIICNPYYL